MLGWFCVLIFAMLPLRNAMPGAPPIGVLADYMSFFWAQAVIAATLIAVVLTWVFRKPTGSFPGQEIRRLMHDGGSLGRHFVGKPDFTSSATREPESAPRG